MIYAERTVNESLVMHVFDDPIIKEAIRDDEYDDNFKPDLYGECWLTMVNENGRLIGIYNIHAHNGVTAEIHAHVLPQYRKQCSQSSFHPGHDSTIQPSCVNRISSDCTSMTTAF